MALPKSHTATYKTKLESVKGEVEFRPFLVKDEKVLLMALEGGDQEGIADAVKKLIASCVLSENVDVDNLPPFDTEKLFIELRKKSIGETVERYFHHQETGCPHRQLVVIDLNDFELTKSDDHQRKIKITDELGVHMRYPTSTMMAKYGTDVKGVFSMIRDCIEYVYDKDTVYKEFTQEEMEEWVGDLNDGQFKKIANFFFTMPTLKHTINYTCEKCGKDNSVEVRGLRDFFI